MKLSHILSLIRIPLGLIAIYMMAVGSLKGFLLIFVLGILSDSFDGVIARKLGEASHWGSFLDKSSDQYFEFLLALALWLYSPFPLYYLIAILLRALVSQYFLLKYLRAPVEGVEVSKREVKVSSVLSLTVFFFYALGLAAKVEAPSLSRGLLLIALPYVLLPIGALMEGINVLRFFPQVVASKEED